MKSSSKREPDPKYRERVYRIVRGIPRGRVMTYGQIAYLLGEGYTPRTVGFTMHGADESNTPWHRVINSQGKCSTGRVVLPPDKQQRMLEREGVKFDRAGRCDLEQFLWKPRRSARKHENTKKRIALYKK
ncbi:MAG TPA: MGMT family protein [Pyrinomonadaceae bacterium]|jgi:methylated-DNA-protein-cysteine methyltransferase-like protein|nr:MGMT family protein [Pyrinomonadaceae bacterium]